METKIPTISIGGNLTDHNIGKGPYLYETSSRFQMQPYPNRYVWFALGSSWIDKLRSPCTL